VQIVHLITSLRGGGTENFLYQLIAHSPPNYSHRVLYLRQDGIIGERLRAKHIEVERITPWALSAYLQKHKPDVLHTCLHWAHQVGRFVGHRAHVPFIVSSQRTIDVWQKPWHRMMDEYTLPFCHAVISNSAQAQSVIEKRVTRQTKRPSFLRIQNGLDPEKFTRMNDTTARLSFGINKQTIAFGTMMRLHAEKGAEKIPAFAEILLSKFTNLILLVAGDGPLEESLRAKALKWQGRVRWMGWQNDSVRFLSALDGFFLLSREESFPQALLEASGAGIPWIAPNVGGIPELSQAGAVGKLYAPNTAEEAAKALTEMVSELPEWKRKAQEAAESLRKKYDLKQTLSTFYEILEKRGALS
jgi:glycosyltransferase involved in cell wall biosynthesis